MKIEHIAMYVNDLEAAVEPNGLCASLDNSCMLCYDTLTCSEGKSFAGNDEPDKATG